MKRHYIKIIALSLALALGLAMGGLAEEYVRELGEIDLYDPAIYADTLPEKRPPEEVEEALPVGEAWQEEGQETGEDDSTPSAEAAPEGPRFSASASELELCMGVGEKVTLGGSVSGYQSDNPSVAKVDAKTGVVTAVATGTARITAVRSSGATVSCVVTVLNAPNSISFEVNALTLGVGEKYALPAQLPEGTASAKIAYASSNEKVVTIDKNGKVHAKKSGTAMVAAKAFNGVMAKCAVTVKKAPTKVTISQTKLVLGKDESTTLSVKLSSKSASRVTWKSSNESVAVVDDTGAVRAVGAGKATIRAATFNKKKADCEVRVLDGATPTTVSLNPGSLTLGVGEKYTLKPVLGADEAAMFAYASSDKKVATVSKDGVIKPKRVGQAVVTVATHNGLTANVAVTVLNAPTEIGLSNAELKIEVGKSVQLSAVLPEGSASGIEWESSDVGVATVDGEGYVTAVKMGTASVRARAFNGVTSPLCCVIVTENGKISEDTPIVITPKAQRMADNLRAYEALGAKRYAIANVVEILVSDGFQPAFAAGVGANILSEGTYGLFESSKYVKNYLKRPRYFCYLDGGNYYVSGRLTAVYMSAEEMETYEGEVEARERFDVENFYLDNYSRKYVYEINLDDLEAFMVRLDQDGWEGKFGVGIVQWTGQRTKKLLAKYRKHAGEGSATITPQQVAAAENEMILYDFRGNYKGVYTAWEDANKPTTNSIAAARSAGSIICLKYEVPVDKEAKAVTRGEKAVEIFKTMMGLE